MKKAERISGNQLKIRVRPGWFVSAWMHCTDFYRRQLASYNCESDKEGGSIITFFPWHWTEPKVNYVKGTTSVDTPETATFSLRIECGNSDVFDEIRAHAARLREVLNSAAGRASGPGRCWATLVDMQWHTRLNEGIDYAEVNFLVSQGAEYRAAPCAQAIQGDIERQLLYDLCSHGSIIFRNAELAQSSFISEIERYLNAKS